MTVKINDEFKSNMATKNIVWLSKSNRQITKNVSHQDITITECRPKKNPGNPVRYNITLRNKSHLALTEWVDIGIYKNRIFFNPSTQKDGGYKAYCFNGCKTSKQNPFLQIVKNDATKELSNFVGSYDLQYDDFYEMYYIEKTEK